MPLAPIPLPADVVTYIDGVFIQADAQLAERMERNPNVHEEMLDMTFIEAVAMNAGPHRTQSDTVVDIDIHFVGGGWHYDRWEVADIGLIVTFRRQSHVLRTKVVLLQSKRLYPRESDFTETHGLARPGGMGYLARTGRPQIQQPRLFQFDEECCYKALQVGDNQWAVIEQYESLYKIPVYYLFYHPAQLPTSVTVPVSLPLAPRPEVTVGATVMPAVSVRAETTQHVRNYAPSVKDLSAGAPIPGMRLPDFIVEDVLACKEGYVAEDFPNDEGMDRIFNQRTGPIAAAILIDINLPETVEQR